MERVSRAVVLEAFTTAVTAPLALVGRAADVEVAEDSWQKWNRDAEAAQRRTVEL